MLHKIKFYLPLFFCIALLLALSVVCWNQFRTQDVESIFTVAKNVPQFNLPLINSRSTQQSQNVDGSIFLEKNSIISVWSVNCLACLQQHEFIKSVAKDKKYNFIGINYKNDVKNALQWLHSYGDPYKLILSDSKGTLSLGLGIKGLPTTLLVDKTGKVIAMHVGVLTNEIWQQKFLLEDVFID